MISLMVRVTEGSSLSTGLLFSIPSMAVGCGSSLRSISLRTSEDAGRFWLPEVAAAEDEEPGVGEDAPSQVISLAEGEEAVEPVVVKPFLETLPRS